MFMFWFGGFGVLDFDVCDIRSLFWKRFGFLIWDLTLVWIKLFIVL